MTAWQEQTSSTYGRHLVAAHDLQAGQRVVEQQPYAAVLYDDQVPLRCDWCFQAPQPGVSSTTQQLLRCTRSRFAHYCSKEHQKAAWRAYYRHECAALVACAPNVPPATVRLAARVLWRSRAAAASQSHQQNPGTAADRLQQQLDGGSWSDVAALLSHWQQLDDARKLQYAQMAVLTREFMQAGQAPQPPQQQQPNQAPAAAANSHGHNTNAPTTPPPPPAAHEPCVDGSDVREIALLLARFGCNNHTICDEELRPIGVGLYPLGALINHSCRPNCVQTFAGRNIVFRSLVPIPAGQQLTISYIELAATRQERRRQLLQQYFFDTDQQPAAAAAGGGVAGEGGDSEQQQQQADQQRMNGGPGEVVREQQEQESGLHKLQLQVQLPAALFPPQQQQQQQLQHELPLWTSACDQATCSTIGSSNGGCGSSSSSGGKSSSSSKPPWPEDAPDRQLCEMRLLLPQEQQSPPHTGAGMSNSTNTRQHKQLRLPGGMCLLPEVHQDSSSFTAASTDAAAAATLSGLFRDLEGLGGVDIPAAPGAAPSGQLAVGSQTQQGKSEPEQPQPQQDSAKLECVQWGDWAPVLQQLAQQQQQQQQVNTTTVQEVAMAGAAVLLLVWHLQKQAEHLTRAGNPAAAVRVCQHALAAADGGGPQADVQLAVSAAALTAGDAATADASPAAAIVSSRGSRRVGVRLVLGPRHVLRLRVLAALLCAAVDACEWQLALQAARQLTPLYELVYPKVWPNLGLHYAMLAKLELLLEQPAAAARAAEAAAAILRVAHGGDAAVVHEVCRTRYEAGAELAAYARGAE